MAFGHAPAHTEEPDLSTTGFNNPVMKRRRFLRRVGGGAAVTGLAGCISSPGASGDDPLRVATYPAFVDAVSTEAGGWVKQEFQARYDRELRWFAPEQELDYFIQRAQAGVEIDADMYLGLTPTDLARTDTNLDQDLFQPLDTDTIEGYDGVIDSLLFDPQDRVVPVGTSYVCLVYNSEAFDQPPTTFEDLTDPAYAGDLLLSSPDGSQTGLDFLYWTIHNFGENGYLDYWDRLVQNDVRILGSWNAAYGAYSKKQRPMVVSFSTDQIYAVQYDLPMHRHQVGFLNNQGYAYIDGIGKFANADRPEAADDFIEFLLNPSVNAEIAKRNIGQPTVEGASLPPDLQELTYTPEERVVFGYDRLKGNVADWVDAWSKQIAGS